MPATSWSATGLRHAGVESCEAFGREAERRRVGDSGGGPGCGVRWFGGGCNRCWLGGFCRFGTAGGDDGEGRCGKERARSQLEP